jgi:hypothetical protein
MNSTRPHHVGGSGDIMWPEETIYSKVATVVPDLLDAQLGPPGEVQELHRYKSDP